MAFPYSLTVPLLKDVKSQMPQAMCEMGPVGLNRNLLVNRDVPPFDNPDLRRAMERGGQSWGAARQDWASGSISRTGGVLLLASDASSYIAVARAGSVFT